MQSFGECTVMVLSVALLVACSRQEKPTAKVPAKTPRVIEIAPMPLPATGAVQTVSKVDNKSYTNSPHYRPPHLSTSTAADKKALRDRQQVFQRDVVQKGLARIRTVYDQELQELGKKEIEVREKDPVLKAAYGRVVEVNSAYEETCVKTIPGYDELLKDSIKLRDQLDAALAQPDAGQPGNRQAVGEIRRKLNHALSEISRMRTAANASDSPVGTAFVKVMTTQSEYQQALLKNDEYVQAKRKVDESASSIKDLTSRQ